MASEKEGIIYVMHPHSNSCSKLASSTCLVARFVFGTRTNRSMKCPTERNPPVYSFNARIRGHVQRGEAHTAWLLFNRMQREGMGMDDYTFTAILPACPCLSTIKQLHSLLLKILRQGFSTVLKTALIDMYFNRGSLVDAVRVFEKMDFKDVVAWNSMISGFVQHGLAGKALLLFLEMQRTTIGLSNFTLCILLKACLLLTALPQGKQIHALVIVRGSDLIVLGTALVGLYSRCGLMDQALKLFGGLMMMGCTDQRIHNALISGFVHNGRLGEALLMLGIMPTKPNQVTFTTLLAACSENPSFRNGEQIHCLIIKYGFKSDTILCNALLDMYAKCGKISSAGRVFDAMKDRNVVSWTSIIDAYGRHGQGIEAMRLFERMVKSNGVSPNSVTFLALLRACCHSGLVDEGGNYFTAMREKYGIDPGAEHYACLIHLLGLSGGIDKGWNLLHNMNIEETTTSAAVWTAMLNACRINMDLVSGELVAKRLLQLDPDNSANHVLVSNFYATLGRWECVEKLRTLMREKGLHKEAGSSWVI